MYMTMADIYMVSTRRLHYFYKWHRSLLPNGSNDNVLQLTAAFTIKSTFRNTELLQEIYPIGIFNSGVTYDIDLHIVKFKVWPIASW